MIVNYDESILSYIASIRRYFGLSSSYADNSSFTKLLCKQRPEKVFVLLIDGMGSRLIKRKLKEDSFLRRHQLYETTTVFPSTTTAATTSIRNGKSPNENGWLGWAQYLKEIDDIIIPFQDKGFYNGKKYPDGTFYNCIPVTSTEEELEKIGIKGRKLFPSFEKDGCEDFNRMCDRLIGFSYDDKYEYIYAYWDKYDSYMHEHGPDSKICDAYLEYINYQIENLASKLNKNTMLVVLADHGQVTINRYYNFYNSRYDKYFVRKPSLETRAQVFFIKDEYKERFEKEFKEEFEDDYILLSKKLVKESKLFGSHENHPRFDELIGDYLAIGKSDLAFIYHEKGKKVFIGQHAGMCDDEMYIPIIIHY